ncbi:hypothetical protein NBH00_08860 [Paraconexibacter antarcticus]|uniref:PepSY domain-containing protein n=1 Tax=Paraconexibacter antarcticus TaxID=2949664 RepID=A0ABY5DZI6_9ACTN|nr:hypothetical protein [Paraconexibacter antarcticus]UTI66302.1 hypothetical protein NBH00_08860 [Paraconexibacter antarcticus]
MSTVLPDPAAAPTPEAWRMRALCAGLLLTAAVLIGAIASSFAGAAGSSGGRAPMAGVLMPDDAAFRQIAARLVQDHPGVRLASVRIEGDAGHVTVVRARRGQPGVRAAYLNPGVVPVLARATGASSDAPTTVRELRLALDPSTGRQRWSLTGTRGGQPWQATVNPNGTDLRHTAPAAAS